MSLGSWYWWKNSLCSWGAAHVRPVRTTQLPGRQRGKGWCEGQRVLPQTHPRIAGGKRKHLSVWGMAMGFSEVTLFHFVWRFNYSTRCCTVILGDKPLPEARAPGLICRGKRVIPCASENTQNQGLCFTFWTSIGQHCVPGDPVKACCVSYLFFRFRAFISPGEHPSDPSFIALAQQEGILLMGTEAWQHCNSKSISACSHWKLGLFTHHSWSALLLHVSSSGSTDIHSSVFRWLVHSCQPALVLFCCRICLG